jgi:hypothetical protein
MDYYNNIIAYLHKKVNSFFRPLPFAGRARKNGGAPAQLRKSRRFDFGIM